MDMPDVVQMAECCYKCKYWKQDSFGSDYGVVDETEMDSGDLDGLCKRHAPQPIITFETDTEPCAFVTWPTTYANDFCGEFMHA